ncbi:MAG TPA: amidohydrolase family protein [Bacteroidota bacterium]
MKLFIISIVSGCLLAADSFAQKQNTIAIWDATLIDGTGKAPVAHAVVLIAGNRIADIGTVDSVFIPPGTERIDAAGKFVIPGLIDTHLHLEVIGLSDVGELTPDWNAPERLRQLTVTDARLDLISGFTSVRDLGSTELVLNVRDEINAGKLVGPRIIAAGMQLVRKDTSQAPEPTFLEYDNPEEARTRVQYLVNLGVDVIKIRLVHSRPIPSLDEISTIVREAHRLGLKATVHTEVPADDLVRLAINAGADGIEHNAPLRSKNEDLLKLMGHRGMSLMAGSGAFWLQRIDTTATIDSLDPPQKKLFPEEILSALHLGIDSVHRQTQQMKNSGWSASQRQASFIAELQRARKAGVLLAFGTDCGGYGMIHGEQYKALYGESQMGSSPMQVIVMATRDAAKAVGKTNELGTIEPGKLADLVILDADPLLDLRNLHHIYRVMKDGVLYDPAELIAMPIQ